MASQVSNYSKRMARLAARIFVEVVRPTSQKSTKVLRLFSEKPLNLHPEIVNYYPNHHELDSLIFHLRSHGLFRDEHLDFKDEMKRLRILRGKVKPKKGEGKRALKRN